MSKSELPDHVDAYRLADQGASMAGGVAFSRMTRVAETVLNQAAQFAAELRFERDSEQRRVVLGHVSGCVELECQRCLKPVEVAIDSQFELAIVYNDEMAKALPSDMEPLMLLPDEPLDVGTVIEDEVLLSLPMHAMHPEGECRIQTEFKPDETQADVESEPASDNPFQVLESLKRSE